MCIRDSYTVENALAKVKDEKGMKRVEKFLKEDICPDCGGTRLSAAARAPKLRGISLDEACAMTLSQLVTWVQEMCIRDRVMVTLLIVFCLTLLNVADSLVGLVREPIAEERMFRRSSSSARFRILTMLPPCLTVCFFTVSHGGSISGLGRLLSCYRYLPVTLFLFRRIRCV